MVIKVFSTPTCPWCHKVKEFLKEKSVEFTDIDVTSDEEGAKEMVEISNQRGVPVTVSGDKFVVGFDIDALEDLLKEN